MLLENYALQIFKGRNTRWRAMWVIKCLEVNIKKKGEVTCLLKLPGTELCAPQIHRLCP